jgi:hypothetical protein
MKQKNSSSDISPQLSDAQLLGLAYASDLPQIRSSPFYQPDNEGDEVAFGS